MSVINGMSSPAMTAALRAPIRAVCFDWGGTLIVDDGPEGVPMNRWPVVNAVAGARECLTVLYGRVPLCVATNAGQSDREMIEEALDRVDLLRFISSVFCFTEIGHPKNRPDFWAAVSKDLGHSPTEIVMIGDSVESDVLAPRRVGFQTVWFNERAHHSETRAAQPSVTKLEVFAEMVSDLTAPDSSAEPPKT